MMYKKGDIVQIRDDLVVGEEYGLTPIKMTYDMKDCCGMIGIVTDIDPVEMTVKVCDWWWSELMVIPQLKQVTFKKKTKDPVTNLDVLREMDAKEAAKEIALIFIAAIDAFVDNGFLVQHKSTSYMMPKIKKAILSHLQAEPEEEEQ